MEASSLDGGPVKLVSIVSGAKPTDFSVKQKQRGKKYSYIMPQFSSIIAGAIIKLLNLNNTSDSDNYWQDVWKVHVD